MRRVANHRTTFVIECLNIYTNRRCAKLTFRALAHRGSDDEGLMLETSAFESLYGGQFTLTIQGQVVQSLIKLTQD